MSPFRKDSKARPAEGDTPAEPPLDAAEQPPADPVSEPYHQGEWHSVSDASSAHETPPIACPPPVRQAPPEGSAPRVQHVPDSGQISPMVDAVSGQRQEPLASGAVQERREERTRPTINLAVQDDGVEHEAGDEVVFPRVLTYGRPHPRAGEPRGLPAVPQAVPDSVLDIADFDGLAVRAASLRGDDHRFNGTPRQDSMGLWTIPRADRPDLLVVAVADGVGSQPLSHRGAAWACWMLRDQIEAHARDILDDHRLADVPAIGRQIGEGLTAAMTERAERHGLVPAHLSTTLVGAVIELSPPDRPRHCVVLRIGDSTAYMLRDGAFCECLGDAHQGEAIVSSATAALPTRAGRIETSVEMIGNDDVLVVCTDGLANPMRNEGVRDRLAGWWSDGRIPGTLEFGWQLGFRAKSFGDDRTAVCVWGHR